jgi:hypothetical protein
MNATGTAARANLSMASPAMSIRISRPRGSAVYPYAIFRMTDPEALNDVLVFLPPPGSSLTVVRQVSRTEH